MRALRGGAPWVSFGVGEWYEGGPGTGTWVKRGCGTRSFRCRQLVSMFITTHSWNLYLEKQAAAHNRDVYRLFWFDWKVSGLCLQSWINVPAEPQPSPDTYTRYEGNQSALCSDPSRKPILQLDASNAFNKMLHSLTSLAEKNMLKADEAGEFETQAAW